ncbi:MAG: succinylglutamate desuccinylase, partial [Alphaproteobacteria bacterium]
MSEESYPVRLRGPDIAPYRAGNTGIDHVISFEATRPGPHVMVSALVHGNEVCGAVALDFLLRAEVRPRQGRLTLA